MAGYTPLFSSLTTGTLLGRWPDIGLWAVMLSMADARGEIDVTQDYIALIAGLSLMEVTECIDRFMQPDPRSRSQVEDGRRLVLIDPQRSWGWKVVNIRKYREKASGQNQVVDGRNADKVKRYKAKSKRADTGGHRQTPEKNPDTHSYSYSYSDTNTDKTKNVLTDVTRAREAEVVWPKVRQEYPTGIYRESEWLVAEKQFSNLVDRGEPPDKLFEAVTLYRAQQLAKKSIGTQFVLSPSKFFGEQHWRGPFPLPMGKAEVRLAGNVDAAAEAKRQLFGSPR